MTRRLRDIVLLLGALQDAPFAQPRSWTSELVRRNAKRGEVPSTRIPCPACGGEKRRRVRTVVVDCDRCLGARGQPLGYIVVDGMIDERFRRRIGTAETGLEVRVKVVPCDRCGGSGHFGNGRTCPLCRGGGMQELRLEQWQAGRHSFAVETRAPVDDAVLASMEARRESGSFDELATALEELRALWPQLWRLVRDVYVLDNEQRERLEVPPLTAAKREAAERVGLGFLSARMPEAIRVPGWLRSREREVA